VGYELSAYACAKTMIVNQLFEDQASVDDIMQVCKTKVPLSHDEYCIYDTLSRFDGVHVWDH
jgi:hypothetical protein